MTNEATDYPVDPKKQESLYPSAALFPIDDVLYNIENPETDYYKKLTVRSMVWFSEQLQRWLQLYQESAESEEFPVAVKRKIINEGSAFAHTLATTLSKLLDFEHQTDQSKRETINELQEAVKFVSALWQEPKDATFPDLQAHPEYDTPEFYQLTREFRHDLISSGFGTLAVVGEEQIKTRKALHLLKKIRSEYVGNGFSELLQGAIHSLNKGIAIQEQKFTTTDKTLITDDVLAIIIENAAQTIKDFSLEKGGLSTELSSLSDIIMSLQTRISKAKIQFKHLDFMLDKEAVLTVSGNTLSHLNKNFLSRLLTNIFSNIDKLKTSLKENIVKINLSAQNGNLVLEISDFGSGFPGSLAETRVLPNGTLVATYSIEKGKTQWAQAAGTGTGLYGMKQYAQLLDIELIVGSRMVDGKVEGGTVMVIAPLVHAEITPPPTQTISPPVFT